MTGAAFPRSAAVTLRKDRGDWLLVVGTVVIAGWLILTLAIPLAVLLVKSLQSSDGAFVGLANYARYIETPALLQSLWNSVWVSALTTAIVVPLAFGYAYALRRTALPLKALFTALALLPLFAPSLLSALSFIYIFGNQGILKSWLMGETVYGPIGIVISMVFYTFPHAMLILMTALGLADQRHYEAAKVLGTPSRRVFWTVTLPGAKYGLISAGFVVFTLSITEFGIPKVIGGQFNVLATDAYKQVVGQQNFEMGAVVGFVLLIPAVLAFAVDRIVQRRQVALLSARAVPLVPVRNGRADLIAAAYCTLVGGVIAAIIGMAVWGSFITYWPYNMTLTLKNYNLGEFDAVGWASYRNSLLMAGTVATLGTLIIFFGAYLVEKSRGFHIGRHLIQFLAMIPMAVPGLVLGLAYVFYINNPANPLGILYGTILLLAVNTIAHFYTVAHMTAVTALKQLDPEFESVSASLKVPQIRTLQRVTIPICLPTILDIAVYLFVNALTTVSAVIFLYGANTKLASIAIVHMDEAGATAAAMAVATLLFATGLGVKAAHLLLDRFVLMRFSAWRRRSS